MQVNSKIVLLVIVAVAVFALRKAFQSDKPEEAAPAVATATAPATSSAASTSAVRVRDANGNPVDLQLADGSAMVVVGTWHPRSRALINALNDPALQSYLHNTRITYLLERDEWPNVKQGLRDSYRGVMSEEQMDAQIAARRAAAGGSGLYDQNIAGFILGTGAQLYYFDRADGLAVGELPAFHTSGKSFTTARDVWLRGKGVPPELVATLLEKHETPPR